MVLIMFNFTSLTSRKCLRIVQHVTPMTMASTRMQVKRPATVTVAERISDGRIHRDGQNDAHAWRAVSTLSANLKRLHCLPYECSACEMWLGITYAVDNAGVELGA